MELLNVKKREYLSLDKGGKRDWDPFMVFKVREQTWSKIFDWIK